MSKSELDQFYTNPKIAKLLFEKLNKTGKLKKSELTEIIKKFK